MRPGKPVEIDTRTFATQTEAKAFFKAMLNRYGPGDQVAATDAMDLTALLKRHTEYSENVGSGISHFCVMAAEYNTQCFQIIRTDGSKIRFSYPHCIDRIAR